MIPERTLAEILPYFTCARVVHGFGRGSKQLGCPTANLDDPAVDRLPQVLQCGVYFGWANVDNGPVHAMVTSIGWNPHFKNRKKTIETHILHAYDSDFYGSFIKIAITGYIREMTSFKDLDELITAINEDIRIAKQNLATVELLKVKSSPYFTAGGEHAKL